MDTLVRVREMIEDIQYPLDVEDQDWAHYPKANCYTYALGLPLDEAFLIGDFIGDRMTQRNSMRETVMVFKEEVEELGFWIDDCEVCEEVEEGCFKVFLNFDDQNNYHLLRQNADGSWSRKTVDELPNQKHLAGGIICNPEAWSEAMQGNGFCFLICKI